MAAMDKAIKKEYIKYTKKHYPDEANAKLIRTHTCALGSESCDYWYVGDESDTAKMFADAEIV